MAAIGIHQHDLTWHRAARAALQTARASSLVVLCLWAATRGVEEGIGVWVRRATRPATTRRDR